MFIGLNSYQRYPAEFELRQIDKLAYRYPRGMGEIISYGYSVIWIYMSAGESYLDVIARLEPIIIEMERHREPLLIVGHQVCSAIYTPSYDYL